MSASASDHPMFESAHAAFLNKHAAMRSGERLRRLRKGHGYAEKLFLRNVWWPAVGGFEHLHPEYEVRGLEGGWRFIDFALILGLIKAAIEVDGYGPHLRNIDRKRFADDRHRQNELFLLGWEVLRFSFDDVQDEPQRCISVIRQYMGSRFGGGASLPLEGTGLHAMEREILRLAHAYPDMLVPGHVELHLGVSRNTAYKWLHRMVDQGILEPITGAGGVRIRSYRLTETGKRLAI